MKVTRSSLLFVLTLTVLHPAFASPATAQEPSEYERQRIARIMAPDAPLEEFRQEMLDYLTEFEQTVQLYDSIPFVHEQYEESGLRPLDKLAAAKAAIPMLSHDELALMKATYARFPGWREAPAVARSFLDPQTVQILEQERRNRHSGVITALGIQDDCALAIQSDITNTDIAIAAGVELAAEVVMEGFPTDGLTILLRLAPIAAWSATRAVTLGLESSKNIKDDCTQLELSQIQSVVNSAQSSIINNDDSNTSSIINNDNSNSSSIINNDNSNSSSIISNDNSNTANLNASISAATSTITANDNANATMISTAISNAAAAITANADAHAAAVQALILRTQIEADLAEESNAVKVAWYMTPTASGGHLDLVQQIVTETIAQIGAAGGNTGRAQSFLTSADAAKASGDFKAAYDNYRKAYKAAAQ